MLDLLRILDQWILYVLMYLFLKVKCYFLLIQPAQKKRISSGGLAAYIHNSVVHGVCRVGLYLVEPNFACIHAWKCAWWHYYVE